MGTAGATRGPAAEPRAIKFGLVAPILTSSRPDRTPRWADTLEFARAAEAAGFDTLWVPDDLLHRFPQSEPLGQWECWSVLAALAAVTQRIELGSGVSAVGFRNPALLAKMSETVDEISGGRVILGIGAGGFEDEHDAFGLPWQDRFSRLEEALVIVRSLLRTGRADFQGRHFSVRDCELLPRGPRPDGIPIMLGTAGHGPRMAGLIAEYADICDVLLGFDKYPDPDLLPPMSDELDAACERVGRDPATLRRGVSIGVAIPGHQLFYGAWDLTVHALSGPAEHLASVFGRYADEGVSHVSILLAPATPAGIEALAPAVVLFRGR